MHLTREVFLVSGMSYGLLGNVYAVRHGQGLFLVDCGRPDREVVPMIEANLAYWGLEGLPITHLLVTHGHPDHVGNARYFQRKGALVVAGKPDADQIIALGDYDPSLFPCVLHDFEDDCLFEPCQADIRIEKDTTLKIGDLQVDVLTTPGHTQGSVVYVVYAGGKKLFFTGDTLGFDGSKGDRPILGTSASVDYDSAAFVRSMQKLLNRHPDAVFGGHGCPRLIESNHAVAAACMRAMAERQR